MITACIGAIALYHTARPVAVFNVIVTAAVYALPRPYDGIFVEGEVKEFGVQLIGIQSLSRLPLVFHHHGISRLRKQNQVRLALLRAANRLSLTVTGQNIHRTGKRKERGISSKKLSKRFCHSSVQYCRFSFSICVWILLLVRLFPSC